MDAGSSTGITRFFTKQIATEGFSTVFVNVGVLYDILKV